MRIRVYFSIFSLLATILHASKLAAAEVEAIFVPIVNDDITFFVPTYNDDINKDGVPDYKDPKIPPIDMVTSFGSALAAGNVDAASNYLWTTQKNEYIEALKALGPAAGQVMKELTNYTIIRQSNEYTEIGVNRIVNGEKLVHIIVLVKDADGVWRIVSI